MFRIPFGKALFGILALLAALAAPAAALETQAEYMVLMDAATGEILAEKQADKRMAPASMSKLMTAAMVFEALKTGRLSLDDKFHVSERAWKMEGSKMWTLVNTDIAVSNLLRGMIIQSGNDACVVLAEGLSGSEERFAEAMTKFGKEIGLTNSTFTNSTGWPDPNHMMTPRDLALLARHIITHYPIYYKIYSERSFTWSKITQENRNRLLWEDKGVDGLKTGHTEESGYGLVSSAERDGRRLILVVNGLPSDQARIDESRRLLDIGFREFDTFELLTAGQAVAEAPVWGGTAAQVPLVVKEGKSVIMSRYDRSKLTMTAVFDAPLQAPVKAGQEVGHLRISVPGRGDTQIPLYAAAKVGRMGPMGALNVAFKSLLTAAFGGMMDTGAPAPEPAASGPNS